MNKSQIDLIDKIGKEAVRLDWEEAFGGKSYGNTHLYRVNKIAKYLQMKEGGDLFIVLVGAWVHDVSLATGSDYDSERVAKETRKFLGNYDLSDQEKEAIVDCAAGHESENTQKSIESMIVHDADAIDKCGSLGIVRHIWKTTNMLKNRVLKGEADLSDLEKHLKTRQANLMTKTAKKLVEKLNLEGEKFFRDRKSAILMMEKISTLAWGGMNADKIVAELEKTSGSDWVQILSDQIKCSFLK